MHYVLIEYIIEYWLSTPIHGDLTLKKIVAIGESVDCQTPWCGLIKRIFQHIHHHLPLLFLHCSDIWTTVIFISSFFLAFTMKLARRYLNEKKDQNWRCFPCVRFVWSALWQMTMCLQIFFIFFFQSSFLYPPYICIHIVASRTTCFMFIY